MKALTSKKPPERAYYRYEGPITVSLPRNLAAGYSVEDNNQARMMNTLAAERPQTSPVIQLIPNTEYLLRKDEFPGMMFSARPAALGRLVLLPDREVPAYKEPEPEPKAKVKTKEPEAAPAAKPAAKASKPAAKASKPSDEPEATDKKTTKEAK